MNQQVTQAPETEEQTEQEGKVRIRPDLNRYVRDKSGNGKRTHRTDDFVARTLAGKGIDEIKQGAAQLGVEYEKWNALNIGQQRMLIGNKLRHFLLGNKPTLTEEQITEVYGEPVPEYDEEAAAASEAANAEQGEVSTSPDVGEQPVGAGTHDISGKPKKTARKSAKK
jgi:hypothetical protein